MYIRLDGCQVQVIVILLATERIIKDEIVVLDELGDAIDTEFTLMYPDLWVGSTHTVNFTCLGFLCKDWSFPYTY